MSASIPKQAKSWTVQGKEGFDSLQLKSDAAISEPSDYEVLVKLYAASLNYRDLTIPKGKVSAQHGSQRIGLTGSKASIHFHREMA